MLGGSIDGVDQTLTDRYAAPPAWRRPVTIAAVVVVALVGLGWLAWAAYVESNPKVQSQLVTFHVVDQHSATARIDVRLASGTTGASCTVEALAADHSVVGELHFTPTAGTNDVTIRTDRMATSVDVPGCVAHGQDRPR
jgi:cytoskeletal protein RodZ